MRNTYTRCPLCGHVFAAPVATSYVTVGRESDLCPKFPGRQSDGAQLLRSHVIMCPACSFAAAGEFEGLDLPFYERMEIEERLQEDGLLRVMRASPPPWLAFHAAEVCGKGRLEARELGDLCLKGSWVCRKEREQPFESTFQLRAVRYFMSALEGDELEDEKVPLTAYLVGELNRRLGNHREALNWYVNAERGVGGREELAWLERMISRQKQLTRDQAA